MNGYIQGKCGTLVALEKKEDEEGGGGGGHAWYAFVLTHQWKPI